MEKEFHSNSCSIDKCVFRRALSNETMLDRSHLRESPSSTIRITLDMNPHRKRPWNRTARQELMQMSTMWDTVKHTPHNRVVFLS